MMPKINEVFHLDKMTKTITPPNIILTTKSFKVLGILKYENWNFSFVGNGMDEVTFDVYKPIDITEDMDEKQKLVLEYEHMIWDNLVDLKLIEVQGYGRFEISVSYTDNTKTTKSIHGVSLECELSQLHLNDFHVNDEEAMSNMEITEYNRDNFDSEGNFIPTTLCNFSDEKHSLLHRVIADKAPHWRIGNQELKTGYVTPYVALDENESPYLTKEFQRTFTCDGESIYDFLTGTVANECNVIFVFDTLNRVINCYSLCDCINQSNGEVLEQSVGKDTNIFITKEKLANEISISSQKDNVKNCFRVVGGDDIITAMVPIANANGSNYIITFSDAQYNDMSDELVNLLKSYKQLLQDSKDEAEELFLDLCEAYEDKYYLESSMMPAVTIEKKTAKQQYELMINEINSLDFFVAVQNNYTSTAFTGVSNSVSTMAQILVDSRFDVSIVGDETYTTSNASDYIGVWTGKIKVTSKIDELDCYPVDIENANTISIKVTKDELLYAEQKVEKALKKGDMLNIKFDLDNSKYLNANGTINEAEVTAYFEQYCLNRLTSFYNGYESCISILAEMGQKDDGSAEKKFYDKYLAVKNIIKNVKDIRQRQVNEKNEEINELNQQRLSFQQSLDIEKYLGDYYLEYCSYRREDTYTNNNYISDGLNDAECLEKAKELLEVAQKEINKACVLQRTLSSDLNNLLMLEEFESLYDDFALFNYVRIQTDDEILKLRLIGIDINGNSLSNVDVTFSDQIESIDGNIDDIKSILDQAKDMTSTFPSTVRQAKKGQAAKVEVDDLYQKGLDASKILLSNSGFNEVTYGGHGILCANQGDTGDYGQKQLRAIGNGIYLTDDAWEHVRMAIGQIEYNGIERYGILCEALIGKMIIGEQMEIGNKNGSVSITGDGINITNGTISWNKNGSGGVNLPIISMEDLEGLTEFTDSINKSIEGLQSQIDGEITSWFEEYEPTTSNEPASLWTTNEEKNKHIGDLFYNTATGAAYRYIYNSSNSTYSWSIITDTAITKALADAAKAQDTADKKRRVFYTTPTPPYDKGDLWSQGENGDLMICTNAKASGSYVASDWVKAVKYTDDTKAQEAIKKAEEAIADAANGINLANTAQSTANSANTAASNAATRAEQAETNSKKYADEKDTALATTLTSAYEAYTNTKISTFDSQVAKYLGLGGGTLVGSNYVVSPIIEGGYLNITNTTNKSKVIIDPNNLTNTGYIFQVHNGKQISVGIDSSGNAIFNGAVTATSLTLGDNVSVPSGKVSGLSTVATSGKYSDLSGKPTIPTKLGDLTDDLNVLTTDDVKVTTSTSNGITTTTTTVGSNTYTTYTSSDGSYLLTNLGIGSDATNKDYFKVSTTGLLTARNALIYGTIYATAGQFTGDISGSTFTQSEGNFSIDDKGIITGKELSIESEISTETLHVDNIANQEYPKTLISSPTIYVNANSGNDDQSCENGAVFQTLQGAINSIPKFMNAKYVYIEMQTDLKEDIDIRGFVGGFIWIYLAGHTLYGRINGYTSQHVRVYGGTFAGGGSDKVGVVHPPYSESNGSTVFNGCFNVYLSKLKIYGADTLASGLNEINKVAIVAQGATYVHADEIEIVNVVRGVSSISAHIHMNKSYGIASETGFYCTTGGLITIATNNQMGGSTRNTYTSNGGEIRYTGVTFETGNASSSTTTAPTTKVAKNVTYTSTKGNAIQYYGTSSAKWRSDNTPKQGTWGYGNHTAWWFFGSNFDNIANKEVTKVEITFTRNSGGNSSAVNHRFYVHGHKTQPSSVAPTYNSTLIGSADVATGNSKTITITNSSLIAAIKAGKGICAIPASQSKTYYSVMSGTMKVKFYYNE